MMISRPADPVLIPSLFVALLLVASSAAAQGLPDPRHSTTDLVVVGSASGNPIGGSPPGFDVVVRDVNLAPMPGRVITLDFSASAMRVFAVQNAGTTVDCAAKTISRVTNTLGAVNFGARVSGYDNTNAIRVFDNGNLLSTVKGRSTDLDGVDGTTGLGDFAIFGANFLADQAVQETDFDLSGSTDLGDFALFGAEFLGGEAHPYCP